MEDGNFTVKYTNKDVMEKLEKISNDSKKADEGHEKILGKILNHAEITNGRVNELEKVSVGMWIRNNPYKFLGVVLIFISLMGWQVIDVVKAFLI